MKIGFCGFGKLALPVALAVEDKGHTVLGYDVRPEPYQYIKERKIPFIEKDIQPLLDKTNIEMVSMVEDLFGCDIIFLAVQTPHQRQFEGDMPLPDDRADFDYSYLIEAVKSLEDYSGIIAVISTCLPRTYERDIKPLIKTNYVYTPQFIAMGTVLDDYLNPEFNLIGVEDEQSADLLEEFYSTINNAPNLRTDITTAEAVKVSYNTFITMKTVLGNTWGELCHKVGANVDDVYKAWSLSSKRLLSPKYLKSGTGDGGGCHPRDNIALSYIAKNINLSHNLFEDLMLSREKHMEFIADEALKHGKRITILGKSFKPETNIETGSPSVLLAHILRNKGALVRHLEDCELTDPVVIIGTQHERYKDYKFKNGTVVIDPFRYIKENDNIRLIQIGKTNGKFINLQRNSG